MRFLNYLVLVLAVLLLDDEFLRRFVLARWRPVRITEDIGEERVRRESRGELVTERVRAFRWPGLLYSVGVGVSGSR